MHANKRIFSFFIKKDLRLTQKPQIFIVPIGHFKIVIMVALDWKSWAENDGDNPWKSLWHFGSPCRKSLSQQVVLRGTSMPQKWFGWIRWNEYPFNQPYKLQVVTSYSSVLMSSSRLIACIVNYLGSTVDLAEILNMWLHAFWKNNKFSASLLM